MFAVLISPKAELYVGLIVWNRYFEEGSKLQSNSQGNGLSEGKSDGKHSWERNCAGIAYLHPIFLTYVCRRHGDLERQLRP